MCSERPHRFATRLFDPLGGQSWCACRGAPRGTDAGSGAGACVSVWFYLGVLVGQPALVRQFLAAGSGASGSDASLQRHHAPCRYGADAFRRLRRRGLVSRCGLLPADPRYRGAIARRQPHVVPAHGRCALHWRVPDLQPYLGFPFAHLWRCMRKQASTW